jgi:hypothetical protein
MGKHGCPAMTADHTAFYIGLLESRLRFLDRQLVKAGRFDPTFDRLAKERDDVALELEGLRDDASPRMPRS